MDVSVNASLRAQMIEQVMRCTRDDLDVLDFLDAEPGSHQALVALGKLLNSVPVKLFAGSPLWAFLRGGPVDPCWRDEVPAQGESLYSRLEFLQTLYAGEHDERDSDPYARLERLRELSLSDLDPFADSS